MTTIRANQWVERSVAGEQARLGSALPPEERHFLNAMRKQSVWKVLDLYRYLELTDASVFQEFLSRLARRGWLVVHDHEPASLQGTASAAVPEVGPEEVRKPEDRLAALLARYNQATEEESLPVMEVSLEDVLSPESDTKPNDAPEVTAFDSPLPEAFLSTDKAEAARLDLERRLAGVNIPEGEDANDANEAALLAAFGLHDRTPSNIRGEVPRELLADGDREESPRPELKWDGRGGLQALLSALGEAPDGAATISVPAYGMGRATDVFNVDEKNDAEGFARLKDAPGADWLVKPSAAPADSNSSGSAGDLPAAKALPPLPKAAEQAGEMSTRSMRRQQARAGVLDQARREAADRKAAKQRLEEMKARQEAERLVAQSRIAEQRRQEDLERGQNTFHGRAERARKLKLEAENKGKK